MVETSGEWKEERLWVLKELERLNEEQLDAAAQLAIYRDREARHRHDLNEAHARIRVLQSAISTARLKSWAATAAASFLGVVVIELLRVVLK